ncbi:FAD-dependent oxidoreductase [Kaustia mangrovi]|uniref:FAD-dependent oxidoreductase n=1 Tax=Kaustia mangrovi TaxID=2593653 RepID=A0A7S8C3S6_9HYPH|nr:FAD/NAD(P)-binding oxidoreductase [Kaustia mangrovi]QPC42787.1 FAD-dependent oxidoreductase [Kaustia mangrovi]
MTADYDLAIIGAGPAGLAAAGLAAELGLTVALLDEQERPGGQIYRAIETVGASRPLAAKALGPDYERGRGLVDAMRAARVDYLPGAVVWNVSRELAVNFSRQGGSREIRARHVLVATGAMERPVPVPGWTRPGVMTVGALQIMLKTSGLVADGRVVLAGSGPLLLLLASQYVEAGAPPAAVVETVPRARYVEALAHLPKALRAAGYLAKGVRLMRTLARAGVPVYRGASDLSVEGGERATGLAFRQGGRERRVEADLVALHQGVVPNQQITRLLGCNHVFDDGQRCFRPVLDDWFATSLDGVSVAGDGGGIGGAVAAEHAGRVAVCGIAHRLGALSEPERDARAAPSRAALDRDLAVRPFLETLYRPPREVLEPADDVLVCRCEEVTAGAVRGAAALGCPGPNQAKSFLRCGMGPCQGRVCGPVVSEIIADALGSDPGAVGYYRIRPPLKPLTLGELAALDTDTESGAA